MPYPTVTVRDLLLLPAGPSLSPHAIARRLGISWKAAKDLKQLANRPADPIESLVHAAAGIDPIEWRRRRAGIHQDTHHG